MAGLNSNCHFFMTEDGLLVATNRIEPDFPRGLGFLPLFSNTEEAYPNAPYSKLTITSQYTLKIKRESIEEEDALCNYKLDSGIKTGYLFPEYRNQSNGDWSKSGTSYIQRTTVKDDNDTVVGYIERKMSLSGFLADSFYDGVLVEYDYQTETYTRTKGDEYKDFTQPASSKPSGWREGIFFDYSEQSVGEERTYYGRINLEITSTFDEFFYEHLFRRDEDDWDGLQSYPLKTSNLTVSVTNVAFL